MTPMRVLDLFSGIGGFSLGLERAGMRTVAFCEFDEFCRRVLRKHWPEVPIYNDVRELTAKQLRTDGIAVDLICGGFPCQDISVAGKSAGINGERSGLWSEFARIIGEARPQYVIVENVSALLGRGLDRVLGDLAALGFDAEWHCIPASAVGAPHRRDRVWIVADADGQWKPQSGGCISKKRGWFGDGDKNVADSCIPRQANNQRQSTHGFMDWGQRALRDCRRSGADEQWSVEPDVGRVAHGVPHRVDRLRSLGNAVVPQIPEMIGRAILAAEAA